MSFAFSFPAYKNTPFPKQYTILSNKWGAVQFRAADFLLDQDTDESGTALVDDPFQRLLQTAPGLLRHMEQLVLQAVVDQLVEALAEDVRLPQADGVVLEILQKALHEVFALLLRPDDGTQLGVDDRLHHEDGRRTGLETCLLYTSDAADD